MDSKLILIRGNSGSGKSTLAKALQHELDSGTLLIPQDVVRREMLWVGDQKGTKPNCNEFGEEAMKGWWREKDLIGLIPEKMISRDMSLEATVETILAEVR